MIGGGNTAIDVAREALRLGASDVTLVYRRTEAEMPAYAHEVEEAREEGVQFRWLTVPVRFLGDGAAQRASSAAGCELGARDASGRPRPSRFPGSEFVLPVRHRRQGDRAAAAQRAARAGSTGSSSRQGRSPSTSAAGRRTRAGSPRATR